MTTESAIDPIKASAARDTARRKWLEEHPAHRHSAVAAFIVSTTQAALSLKHCIEVGDATGWAPQAADAMELISGMIQKEFRKQFGRELFEQSRNP